MMKNDRIKKLEKELRDLEYWLELNLVPKRDIESHKKEIKILKERIEEEKARLQSIKENGDNNEYSIPKRNAQQRAAYQEPHTLPGASADESSGMTAMDLDNEMPTTYETESGTMANDEGATTIADNDEEDPFSDRNRWRRGILEDPDSNSW
ncbi:MAG: hypothetical protein QNJ27_03945 [Simkaniaceae bacterium]|nr:hypothetical protein [Simkaniaceae bacterium]